MTVLVSSVHWSARVASASERASNVRCPNSVSINRFKHEAFRLDDMPACRDHLFAFRLKGAARAERRIDGVWERTTTRTDSITIVPADHDTSWRIEGRGEMLHVFIPPALMRRAAEEDLDVQSPAILPRLGAYDPDLRGLVRSLAHELKEGLIGSRLYVESVTTQIAVFLIRRHSTATAPSLPTAHGLSDRARRRVLDYIEIHLHHDLTLSELAGLAGLSRSHFSASFRASLGQAPYRYVLERRIARAKMLLAATEEPVAEIALAAGFANQAHFTTTFKRFSGLTPAVYRAQTMRRSNSFDESDRSRL